MCPDLPLGSPSRNNAHSIPATHSLSLPRPSPSPCTNIIAQHQPHIIFHYPSAPFSSLRLSSRGYADGQKPATATHPSSRSFQCHQELSVRPHKLTLRLRLKAARDERRRNCSTLKLPALSAPSPVPSPTHRDEAGQGWPCLSSELLWTGAEAGAEKHVGEGGNWSVPAQLNACRLFPGAASRCSNPHCLGLSGSGGRWREEMERRDGEKRMSNEPLSPSPPSHFPSPPPPSFFTFSLHNTPESPLDSSLRPIPQFLILPISDVFAVSCRYAAY